MNFPQEKFRPEKDKYSRARGGTSKFLYIACANCAEPVMVYQKDGPGSLLRTYADRIVWPPELVNAQKDVTPATIKQKKVGALACGACNNVIGNPMIYAAEDRPAYRIVRGSIHTFTKPPAPEPMPEPEASQPDTPPEVAE